ncbi:MAG: hypothetical protein COA78_04215 [Blastopirellula sp.]|nr:MAG: hypothetical protein COA78_04215 [Blastopirellula sp.]
MNPNQSNMNHDAIYAFEQQLAIHDKDARKAFGVFYTPRIVARSILLGVHQVLQDKFALKDGLADQSTWSDLQQKFPCLSRPDSVSGRDPFISILEPSLGTGIFGVELIFLLHFILVKRWKGQGSSDVTCASRWQEYVDQFLFLNFHAIEILQEPAHLAQQNMLQALETTGYKETGNQQFDIRIANALSGDSEPVSRYYSVVIGNPPYSGVSSNQGDWINGLLRGKNSIGAESRSYYEVAGKPLNEKKLWLSDDYVKFIRLAHWHIDRCGAGVVGMVTNHGYLDNPTFRGMRYQLQQSFDQIQVLDLHGNVKKKEKAEDGSIDQSVFQTEQGAAIGLFAKTPNPQQSLVKRGDLRGTRVSKLEQLDQSSFNQLANAEVRPCSPFYFFMQRNNDLDQEYQSGISILDLMPGYTSAVVTARDHLVIDINRGVLLERIALLRDSRISDEEIRTRFFPRPRSKKYPAGDTRGWKLSAAREKLRNDSNWKERIQRCAYRALDDRWIYWSSSMIDWPRGKLMEACSEEGNKALIVRRQMLSGHECNFFWVTNKITVDGIIRSDNRGNETVVPLYVQGEANVQVDLLAEHLHRWGLNWSDDRSLKESNCLNTESLLATVYALFYSTEYRTRYADQLCVDYPRVFFPKSEELLTQLIPLGKELIRQHLMTAEGQTDIALEELKNLQVDRGFPKYMNGEIRINRESILDTATEDQWNYKFGTHQVMRKWLKDRRGKTLSRDEVNSYRRVKQTIIGTQAVVTQIDQLISEAGGFTKAFCVT